jgi:hypothetical protein
MVMGTAQGSHRKSIAMVHRYARAELEGPADCGQQARTLKGASESHMRSRP